MNKNRWNHLHTLQSYAVDQFPNCLGKSVSVEITRRICNQWTKCQFSVCIDLCLGEFRVNDTIELLHYEYKPSESLQMDVLPRSW